MSAVRMVAYGVLEMKHSTGASPFSAWLDITDEHDRAQLKQEYFEREQLRKLVNDELKRYGMLLSREVVPNGNRWRTRNNAHVLYGQVIGNEGGFKVRERLCEGDFKECCVKAAELLDKLDASQIEGT